MHILLVAGVQHSDSVLYVCIWLPGGSAGKEPIYQCRTQRDAGLIPGLGRAPGEGNSNLLQYSYLENSMDRGTWQATVHGVPKS